MEIKVVRWKDSLMKGVATGRPAGLEALKRSHPELWSGEPSNSEIQLTQLGKLQLDAFSAISSDN